MDRAPVRLSADSNAVPTRPSRPYNLVSPQVVPIASMPSELFSSLPNSRWGLILVALVPLCVHYTRRSKQPSLPPGPRGLPFVGNIFDVPSDDIWLKFAELGDVWGMSSSSRPHSSARHKATGGISSLSVLGQTMVIVNSLKVAEDLLDVRGANFSERPVIPMGGELAGFKNTLPLAQYGDRVRRERKLFHQLFGSPAAVNQFVPLLSLEIQTLLQHLISTSGAVVEQVLRFVPLIISRPHMLIRISTAG
jgi:hypothetical protein